MGAVRSQPGSEPPAIVRLFSLIGTDMTSITSAKALQRLKDGNARFVAGASQLGDLLHQSRRDQLVAGQSPFAVVIGCSDSRVPVELIFDQGLGDLFVIRVAGNVVAPSQIGSVEFAAEQFGCKLVVVLGHTRCGAVQATLDELRRPSATRSPNLHAIVDRIRPAVEGLLATDLADDGPALDREAVRSNVRFAAKALRHGSAILERLTATEGLTVVGAEYALATGAVEFFETATAP